MNGGMERAQRPTQVRGGGGNGFISFLSFIFHLSAGTKGSGGGAPPSSRLARRRRGYYVLSYSSKSEYSMNNNNNNNSLSG